MKINKLILFNFRCFDQYELNLADRFNLLIGDNGSGKTAILDGLAVALGGFLLGIPLIMSATNKRHISRDDIRYKDLTLGQTALRDFASASASVFVYGVVNNTEIEWSRHKSLSRKNTKDTYELLNIVKKLVSEEKTNYFISCHSLLHDWTVMAAIKSC